MTVDTPFPQRPPTPFWSSRGPNMAGLGDDATTIATTALSDATAAFISTQTPACTAGYTWNPSLQSCQLTTGITSGGSGTLILILLLGVLFVGGK